MSSPSQSHPDKAPGQDLDLWREKRDDKVSGFRGRLYGMTTPSGHPENAPGQDLGFGLDEGRFFTAFSGFHL